LATASIFSGGGGGGGGGRRRREKREKNAWQLLCDNSVAYPDSLHCTLQLTFAAVDSRLGIVHVH